MRSRAILVPRQPVTFNKLPTKRQAVGVVIRLSSLSFMQRVRQNEREGERERTREKERERERKEDWFIERLNGQSVCC